MGHKISPFAIRLGINQPWRARWFFSKHLPLYLEADFHIRNIITKLYDKSGISDVVIERKGADHCIVIIKTAKPGVLIGREGQNLKRLQRTIDARLQPLFDKANRPKPTVTIQIEEIKKPNLSAHILAQLAAVDIEKRLPIRRAMKKVLERARQHNEVLGIRVKMSGRLNGAEISRREVMTWGKMPLGTLRSVIDYAEERAQCTYGTIGIKVWIHHNNSVSNRETNV